jgi:hypothetical protein
MGLTRKGTHAATLQASASSAAPFDLDAVLQEVNVFSLDELISTLQKAEESMFHIYSELQDKNLEAEKMEIENKKLQEQVLKEVCTCNHHELIFSSLCC